MALKPRLHLTDDYHGLLIRKKQRYGDQYVKDEDKSVYLSTNGGGRELNKQQLAELIDHLHFVLENWDGWAG